MSRERVLAVAFFCLVASTSAAGADDAVERLPNRWGFAVSGARSVNPPLGVNFGTISYIRDYDHGYVWGNEGPPALRFRTEFMAGLASVPEPRALAAGNVLAVRYIDFLAGPMFRPYVEGGVGLIYTDFRVRGQGLRFNFDPQFGLGCELKAAPDVAVYLGARWHHISNAGINHNNRGINSILLTTGVLFR